MSSSPFPPNAILTFQLAGGSESIDSLGNPTRSTEDLIVVCYLKQSSAKGQGGRSLDGGEISRIALEGRIVGRLVNEMVEPLPELPPEILPGSKAIASINRVSGNLTGDFFLEPTIPSAFGVDAVLGGKIGGYLVTAVAWGEAL